MITIAEAISDLLFVRETVVVPGLGAFVKKAVSAQVDLDTNRFAPPSSIVEFNPVLREENDLVVRYLVENNNIASDEAAKMLASFVADCFNALKAGKNYVLEGVGTLSYDSNGGITFEQDDWVNYNSDAFGLAEFTAQPVANFKTKEEIKAEIEEQQRLKNTPVTVDEEAVHEGEPDNRKMHALWHWAMLAACVLIGGFFGLRQFGVFQKRPTEPVNVTKEPAAATVQPSAQEVVQTVIPSDVDADQQAVDSVIVSDPSLTREVAATRYRVVAGCYDREDNAMWFANVLRNVGFNRTFYEKRGERWFVAFADYATYDEALEALMDIRNNYTYQAWILVPQEQ